MEKDEVKIYLPIRTVSESNLREHWAKKSKRVKAQREETKLRVADALRKNFKNLSPEARKQYKNNYKNAFTYSRLDITLTRIAPRKLDRGNLGISFKAIQDGISDAIGIDDGDARLYWRYEQRKGKPKEYAVEVEIT